MVEAAVPVAIRGKECGMKYSFHIITLPFPRVLTIIECEVIF